jgi:nucleotide-binding universal stress UspA family protein
LYRAVLLVYDGSAEGLVALSEGARIAEMCQAHVFVLAVAPTPAALLMGQMMVPGLLLQQRETYEEILDEGLRRLRDAGFEPKGRLAFGNPGEQIRAVAVEFGADLVVVGHKRRSGLWGKWNSSATKYLADHLDCSLLVGAVVATDWAVRGRTKSVSSSRLLGRRE